MRKIFVLFLYLSSLLFSQENEMSKMYGHLSNKDLVVNYTKDMNSFIIRNGGVINVSPYQELVNITSLVYPTTVIWTTLIDIESYKKDLITAYKQKGDYAKYKDEINTKLYSASFDKWLIDEMKKNTIINICTKQTDKYLIDRGIGISYVYKSKKDNSILDEIHITQTDCRNK